jgi:hypothetical protein
MGSRGRLAAKPARQGIAAALRKFARLEPIAVSQAAFERDLEAEVTAINATKASLCSGQSVVTNASI